MQLIGKVTDIRKMNAVRRVDIQQGESGSAFAQLLEEESRKHENQSDKGVEDTVTVAVSPSVLEGKMNGYNNHAKAAYFYMAFSTTDLKG